MPTKRPVYAAGTTVTAARSTAEMQELLERHGAALVMIVRRQTVQGVAFQLGGYAVFSSFPGPDKAGMLTFKVGTAIRRRTVREAEAKARQETARLWRSLLLITKARLEAVASGIQTVEHAFLPDLMRPDGRIMLEHVRPMLPDRASRDLLAS